MKSRYDSVEGQQDVAAEHGHAAPQGLLAPVPLRLAGRPGDAPARAERRVGDGEREDDGTRTTARRALQTRAQGPPLQPVHHDVGYHSGKREHSWSFEESAH